MEWKSAEHYDDKPTSFSGCRGIIDTKKPQPSINVVVVFTIRSIWHLAK